MLLRYILLSFALSLLGTACRQTVPHQGPALLTYFRPLPPTDTLHVEVASETDSPSTGDTIPNHLFFNTIPAALLREIEHVADSAQAIVLAGPHFALNEQMAAYLVDIRQFWYQHQSLLVYDRRQKAFTQRITLAEWYGGDGGQVLTGSWLFDYDGDGKKDILRREIQHSMTPNEAGEPLETNVQSADLLLWKNGAFVETPLPDTAGIIRRFPIRNPWD